MASGIRYEIRNHGSQTAEALATLKAKKAEAIAVLSRSSQEMTTASLESVLKGTAIELWSDAAGERFWLVADEADAATLGEPRGTVYTAAEARRVIQIGDPATVAEVHSWKRQFDGVISGMARAAGKGSIANDDE